MPNFFKSFSTDENAHLKCAAIYLNNASGLSLIYCKRASFGSLRGDLSDAFLGAK
jgi:hypothetical protein